MLRAGFYFLKLKLIALSYSFTNPYNNNTEPYQLSTLSALHNFLNRVSDIWKLWIMQYPENSKLQKERFPFCQKKFSELLRKLDYAFVSSISQESVKYSDILASLSSDY